MKSAKRYPFLALQQQRFTLHFSNQSSAANTPAERDFVADCGIRLMQGYLFAKLALRAMAPLREEAFAPAR